LSLCNDVIKKRHLKIKKKKKKLITKTILILQDTEKETVFESINDMRNEREKEIALSQRCLKITNDIKSVNLIH
jgi:hypothetical protein